MKLQQLRYLCEVARQGLNVSAAAERLHTSQPGVSKAIRQLETELGIEVYVRNGKRVTGITSPGRTVLAIAERILREAANLKRAGEDFVNESSGTLTIATTHTQARYALPKVVKRFRARYPEVALAIHQGNPTQVSEHVLGGEADFGIATEALANYPELVTLPCYQWNRVVVVPPRHALLRAQPLTLEAIAGHPVITYDFAFTGRSQTDKAFAQRGLAPNIVLTAIDADVIKSYVELGMGVGIVARMAFDARRDRTLRAIDASHLFESSTTRLAIRAGSWLRGYAYEFIEMFAPQLARKTVEAAVMGARGSDYEL